MIYKCVKANVKILFREKKNIYVRIINPITNDCEALLKSPRFLHKVFLRDVSVFFSLDVLNYLYLSGVMNLLDVSEWEAEFSGTVLIRFPFLRFVQVNPECSFQSWISVQWAG